MKESKKTTLWTSTRTLERLDNHKNDSTESYDVVINRLLDEIVILRDWREKR